MPHLTKTNQVPTVFYRPEQRLCPLCHAPLKRDHILWHKHVTFSTGAKKLVSWAYRCPDADCQGSKEVFRSLEAETVHLKYRRFSRELVVRVGYQHFWQHRTMYETHASLTQELRLTISAREVAYLFMDFLALLRAAQPAKIRHQLNTLPGLVVGLDGMQPEKGNDCLYIVRELQCGVTLLAENLTESSQEALCTRLFVPLQALAVELGRPWRGVVSDAQESIRLAVAHSLKGVPHQACQSHCLRGAGQPTFEADRAMKTDLKAVFRQGLVRLHKRIAGLSDADPFRPVLLEYADAMRSTLLETGVAPFALGGVKVFEDLVALEESLTRCQKNARIRCCAA